MKADRPTRIPLHQQIAAQLRHAIESEQLVPGHRLDNEIDLAGQFGVSRGTMRQAIQALVISGLLVRKRGTGTTVLPGAITRPLHLTSMFDDLIDKGHKPVTTVLLDRVIPAPPEAVEELQLPPDAMVLHLRRLRALGGQPLAILENYLPVDLLDLTAIDLTTTGLYQALRAVGVHPKVARQRIGARTITHQECQLLALTPESPVLTMNRLTHSITARPLEWAQHIYRPDRYTFTVTLTAP
ncbi:GntR family transcriptional regulator [Nakamurella sp. GG22]